MKNISLSFVIPVYNEQDRIDLTFKALKELSLPRGLTLKEIIFVNDGSTDKTARLIEKSPLSKKYTIKLLTYSQNMGKGFALKQGMLQASGDYALFFDADMSTPLTELKKFIPALKNNIPVIIGTRKNGHSTVIKHQPLHRELMGKGFTLITRIAISSNVTDFTCGFKAFSKSAKNLIFTDSMINRWGYDAEIVHLASKYSLKIQEISVLWANDKRTKVRLIPAIMSTFIELSLIVWNHRLKRYFAALLQPRTALHSSSSNLIK